MHKQNVLAELEQRGLLHTTTDRNELNDHLNAGPIKFFVGFDPTAESLHLGNLVQLLTAKRLQEFGHTPVILVGGATGMIGDPRDTAERTLNSAETVQEWTEKIKTQVSQFVSFTGENAAVIVNNHDWISELNVIDFLRDVGKHFPVNRMLARETVKRRLEDGISFTEFSYILLQSTDFLHLNTNEGVTLQFGGSDQWGNLTGGVDLIRRNGGKAHAFCTPLLTKADGTKFGKSEDGAVWLNPKMFSPFEFHQFWLNTEDSKVGELLRIFTFLPMSEIEELDHLTVEEPWKRAAQSRLADEVTELVHGREVMEQVRAAASALFSNGGWENVSTDTLESVFAAVGTVNEVETASVVELLVTSGLASSKNEARRLVNDGGVTVNGDKPTDPNGVCSELLRDRWVVVRRGKKRFAVVDCR